MKKGYCNGSDMLLIVNGKAVGHCTTHTVSISAETKDRAVKPVATKGLSAGLWKESSVTGLAVTITSESLRFYGETELGLSSMIALILSATAVTVKCCERNEADSQTLGDPYLSGDFVVTKCDHTAGAQDDVTCSIELKNSGEVDYDESAFTEISE